MKSEYLDLFEGYFSGKLEEPVRLNIESQLKSDSVFNKAFNEYKVLREGIDYSIMRTLKEDLQTLEQTLPEVQIKSPTGPVSKEPAMTRRFTLLKVAAAIVLVAVSVIIFQLRQPTSPQDLYSQYFKPYDNEFVSPKRGVDQSLELQVQSFREYDNGNFSSAIEGFNKILEEDQENTLVLFYLGNAQLAENDGQAAIITFKRFLELSQDFTMQAKWYLALSYLKEDDVDEAKVLLEELENNEEIVKQAVKILKDLR